MLAADEIGMLALPADPGRLGERFFQDRRGVDEDLELAAPGSSINRARAFSAFLTVL